MCVFSLCTEDLSKSEDKEDIKKEGEDSKAAKKAEDPEVHFASISVFYYFLGSHS